MKIEKLDNQGRGITYIDGLITFVNNALPGEDVDCEIIKTNKKFNLAVATSIREENSNRIIPKCPYYELCGGCNLLHINQGYEDEYKNNKVKEILKKYAGIDQKVRLVENDKELFYRNKISLKIIEGKWGYFNQDTHQLCEIDACLIANQTINDFLKKKNILNIQNGTITIRCNYLKQLLLIINTDDDLKIDTGLLPNNIAGLILNSKCIYKNNYFYDEILDMKFKVSYDSFFQINNFMAGCIFKILRNNLQGKNLLDLYCGVGTLGLSLKDNFKNIYGIEKVKNAIIDAKENALMNGVSNAFYYAGDTGTILNKIKQKFDTIVVDPPRSGLNKETLDLVLKISPKQIGYVSCDPMTLARDLKILLKDYHVSKVYSLNMFCQTHHVETVCLLNKK